MEGGAQGQFSWLQHSGAELAGKGDVGPIFLAVGQWGGASREVGVGSVLLAMVQWGRAVRKGGAWGQFSGCGAVGQNQQGKKVCRAKSPDCSTAGWAGEGERHRVGSLSCGAAEEEDGVQGWFAWLWCSRVEIVGRE